MQCTIVFLSADKIYKLYVFTPILLARHSTLTPLLIWTYLCMLTMRLLIASIVTLAVTSQVTALYGKSSLFLSPSPPTYLLQWHSTITQSDAKSTAKQSTRFSNMTNSTATHSAPAWMVSTASTSSKVDVTEKTARACSKLNRQSLSWT
jgi:hypothetical protein